MKPFRAGAHLLLFTALLAAAAAIIPALASDLSCGVCGKAITGRYVEVDGKTYHPQCYEQYRVPRCAVCGEPLEGSYLTDGWGNPFHARHGEDLLCPFCNRVMTVSTTHGSFISTAN